MGEAKRRRESGDLERRIKKARRFYDLCKKLTSYTEHQIIRLMQIREYLK